VVGDYQQWAFLGEIFLTDDLKIGKHRKGHVGQPPQQTTEQTPARISRFKIRLLHNRIVFCFVPQVKPRSGGGVHFKLGPSFREPPSRKLKRTI